MRSRLLVLLALLSSLPAAADELTVGWISRQPEVDYVWNSANPNVEGWPRVGEQVTWRAHIRNWSSGSHANVGYRWLVDGKEAAAGRMTLAANAYTTVDLPWSWTFDRHRIAFEIDTTNAVAEESETNNALEVFSDALSVGFWVEQSLYDWFRAHQHRLGVGSTNFENWAQRQIELFNDMAAIAIYPETPNGVLDRWRLQKIVVVPDGALPLHAVADLGERGGEPNGGTHPAKDDRAVDLMWGFRAHTVTTYSNLNTVSLSNPFYLAPVLLHELGHARYLIDVYAWNVRNEPPHFTIDITENGARAFGPGYVYRTPEQGLMNQHFSFIDRYSAIAMNKIAGHRATRGNYNEPENFGSFMNDLPAQNRLTIRDASGALMTDANVWIYHSVADSPAWYATNYDDTPDLRLRTDANGQVLVGRNPFSLTRDVYQYWRGTNDVAIVRVEKGGRVLYGFLESRIFNLAYWRGHTSFAHHDFVVGAPNCSNLGPTPRTPSYDAKASSSQVTLTWNRMTDATLYRVYVSVDGSAPRLVGTTANTSIVTNVSGRVYWWVEADSVSCGTRRSESFRLTAPAPSKTKRRAAR